MLREGLQAPDAVLREDDAGSTCQPVTIRRSGKSVFISFNAKVKLTPRGEPVCIKDRLFPLLREQEGVTRMCDYWILCEQGDEAPVLYVLLCELKSNKADGVAQLENGKLLAEHFVKMVGHHRGLPVGRVEYRGLIFSRVRAPKVGLRPGKIGYTARGRLALPVVFLRDGSAYDLSALCSDPSG
jgi:hypothetical protein